METLSTSFHEGNPSVIGGCLTQKGSNVEPCHFVCCSPEQTVEQTVELPVIILLALTNCSTNTWVASDLRIKTLMWRHRNVLCFLSARIRLQLLSAWKNCLILLKKRAHQFFQSYLEDHTISDVRLVLLVMTSSQGNAFRVTGHLWGEFADYRWIPFKKGQWYGPLMFLLMSVSINIWKNNSLAGDLRRQDGHVTSLWWRLSATKFCAIALTIHVPQSFTKPSLGQLETI